MNRKPVEIYRIPGGTAIDVYAFGYRIRYYSNPRYFKITNTREWVKV